MRHKLGMPSWQEGGVNGKRMSIRFCDLVRKGISSRCKPHPKDELASKLEDVTCPDCMRYAVEDYRKAAAKAQQNLEVAETLQEKLTSK